MGEDRLNNRAVHPGDEWITSVEYQREWTAAHPLVPNPVDHGTVMGIIRAKLAADLLVLETERDKYRNDVQKRLTSGFAPAVEVPKQEEPPILNFNPWNLK